MARQVKMTFVVDEELRRRAKIKAAQTGQSISSFLRECLRKWVEEPLLEAEEQEEQERKTT